MRAVVCLAFLAALSAGCGSSSGSKEPDAGVAQPAPSPAPTPTPATPPPPRPATGQLADEERLKTLVQGKTTKAEVRELFGIPQEIVVSPGIESFIYFRDQIVGFFSRTTERVEMLTVRFDSRGILKDFEYRYSGK
jgi:outer membrane protein assembly factor BamE (lipoprotein component of BamABCDE complex)